MEGQTRYEAIKAGLKKALHLQGVHKEVMANRENMMPAKPAIQEKPANVVELSDEEVEEASELADNNYTDKEQDEDKKVA